jgi:cytochrome c peroxidase
MYQSLAPLFRHFARKLPLFLSLFLLATAASAIVIPNLLPYFDPTGLVATYSEAGPINENPNHNPFFQSLGTNGRSCGTCHKVSDAMGLSGNTVRRTFASSNGHNPLFASVDGANCPNGSPNNPADHSLLLKHGLIRVFLPIPANAQFTISAVHDPYGCAIAPDSSGVPNVSVYRRPLPTTNLGFLSAVMFDGRESSTLKLDTPATFRANLIADLMHQSVDATLGHAQATAAPTVDQQTAIVNFELGLYSAQIADFHAGPLFNDGADGGPVYLSKQKYYPGANDVLGKDPNGHPFDSSAFHLYDSWANNSHSEHRGFGDSDNYRAFRKKIAAGEVLFNTRELTITSVRGLNDNPAVGTVPVASFQGFCTTCHDTPNVGNHSLPLPLDIGTGHNPAYETDPIIAHGVSQLDFPDLPIYAISGCPDPFATAPSTEPYIIYTTDPGKALLTGQCGDLNRIKGPVLRGLAARAPYFHNGAAQDLTQLINFYNQRFQMNLTDEEKSDLIAFLNSL